MALWPENESVTFLSFPLYIELKLETPVPHSRARRRATPFYHIPARPNKQHAEQIAPADPHAQGVRHQGLGIRVRRGGTKRPCHPERSEGSLDGQKSPGQNRTLPVGA